MYEGYLSHLSTPIGIHRVMKEPYDDREIFESIDDLWDYCKNGTRYNGQKVACIIGTPGNGKGYVQNFTICRDFPLIDIPNGETIIDKDKGILIYNYNPFVLSGDDKIMYDSNKTHYNYLNNPSKFSIISLLKTFRSNTSTQYTFTIVKCSTGDYDILNFQMMADDLEDVIYGNSTSATYEYDTIDPITAVSVEFAKNSNDSVFHIKYGPRGGVPTNEYNIIPKINTEDACIRMYVKADDYVKAMGEG